jgi:hypothetical protein
MARYYTFKMRQASPERFFGQASPITPVHMQLQLLFARLVTQPDTLQMPLSRLRPGAWSLRFTSR